MPRSATTGRASSSRMFASTSTTTTRSSSTCWSSSTRARPRRRAACSRRPPAETSRSPRSPRNHARPQRRASTPTEGVPMSETIVLIHGLWMTPLSWEHWSERFTAAGHEVVAPAWPGMQDRSVESLRADTSAFERIGVTEIADHYEAIVRGLDRAPVIIGHSFGGLVTQILLDRGLGAAGVAVHPAPPKGIY